MNWSCVTRLFSADLSLVAAVAPAAFLNKTSTFVSRRLILLPRRFSAIMVVSRSIFESRETSTIRQSTATSGVSSADGAGLFTRTGTGILSAEESCSATNHFSTGAVVLSNVSPVCRFRLFNSISTFSLCSCSLYLSVLRLADQWLRQDSSTSPESVLSIMIISTRFPIPRRNPPTVPLPPPAPLSSLSV
ncbi:hypothetical protein ES703_78741 [subsurface metagenome]